MRIRVILPFLLSTALVLLGLGLWQSSRARSALRLENAILKEELDRLSEAEGKTQDVERALADAKNQLEDLKRLRAEMAASVARDQASKNLLAEKAGIPKNVEKLSQEPAPQELNQQPVAAIDTTAAIPQTPGDSSAAGYTNTLWSQEQIEAYRCANNLLQINLAATLWAQAHEGYAPVTFAALHEYLAPMTLICPSRRPRSLSVDWRNFDASAITYAMSRPGVEWEWPGIQGPSYTHYAYCPFHQISTENYPRLVPFPSKYSINR